MCYGSKPVVNSKGGVDWIPNDDFNRMYKFGEIELREDGYHYAKETIGGFVWRNEKGEKLESCSILTMDSLGNDKIRAIWHERTPIILRESQVQEWLDPHTTPQRAMAMFKLYPADRMEVKEMMKAPKGAKAPGGAEQIDLGLF